MQLQNALSKIFCFARLLYTAAPSSKKGTKVEAVHETHHSHNSGEHNAIFILTFQNPAFPSREGVWLLDRPRAIGPVGSNQALPRTGAGLLCAALPANASVYHLDSSTKGPTVLKLRKRAMA